MGIFIRGGYIGEREKGEGGIYRENRVSVVTCNRGENDANNATRRKRRIAPGEPPAEHQAEHPAEGGGARKFFRGSGNNSPSLHTTQVWGVVNIRVQQETDMTQAQAQKKEDDQIQITMYLQRRLDDAERLLNIQGETIENLLRAAERELDDPGSVDWDALVKTHKREEWL